MVQTDKPASRVGRLTQGWSAYAALAEPIVYPQDFCFQTVIRYDLVRYLGFAYKSAADFKLFWPLALQAVLALFEGNPAWTPTHAQLADRADESL